MTEYRELVKALRCCTQNPPETCVGCTYNIGNNECAVRGMMCDAADAIEELKKGKAIANRKLDSVLKKLPKCGKWIRIDKHTIQCPLCHRYLDLRGVNAGRGDANYCPNCGADMRKMEVQDA